MNDYRLKGASGTIANKVFPLGRKTVIGSAEECDLRVEDSTCAPRHCIIEVDDNGTLELRHVASGSGFETRVNGEAVASAVLARGDELQVGTSRWVVQAPGLRPQRVLTGKAVRKRRSLVPWLLIAALAGAAALAWQRGWLPW